MTLFWPILGWYSTFLSNFLCSLSIKRGLHQSERCFTFFAPFPRKCFALANQIKAYQYLSLFIRAKDKPPMANVSSPPVVDGRGRENQDLVEENYQISKIKIDF